jgi:hypothetical protein
MTKWMLIHQIGEAVASEIISNNHDIFNYAQDKFDIMVKMVKTKAGRTGKIGAEGDVLAEFTADLLWHGKIRRHKTAEEIGIPISTEEMHNVYDKIENVINDILSNSVGSILWGVQTF